MATRLWSPGEFITPGDLRQPRTTAPTSVVPLQNPSFETAGGWTFSNPGLGIIPYGSPYEGSNVVRHSNGLFGTHEFANNEIVQVLPGQTITASGFYRRETNVTGRQGMSLNLRWFDSSMTALSDSGTELQSGATNVWYYVEVTGTAPASAAYCQLVIRSRNNNTGGPHAQYFDSFNWNYIVPTAPAGLVYKAVQANAGYTAAIEPVWPLTLGVQVVDNEVTWEAVLASTVTWEAKPILVSGAVEPTWPLDVGASTLDNTISWRATSRRITDEKCPNTKTVVIGASKIFAGDDDIIRFSATINPLDWSTPNDAGYLPFGLQEYGSNPVAAMGLYRSNLVAFNSEGFQMWQIDQDPASMAFLDAVPVGSTYPRAVQPFANDLGFVNPIGVRNISIAGASTNLQADGIGEPIDPLVTAELLTGTSPIGLFWPARGQYWVFFGAQAFVMTVNASKKKSWSRYVFPSVVDDWTLQGNDLYLRSGVKVWKVDDTVTRDDVGGTPTDFTGVIWWPFLDFDSLGDQKDIEAIDLVANAPGGVTISLGWNQLNRTQRTAEFAMTPDTLTGTPAPFPMSAPSIDLRLTFAADQKWEWLAANIYYL